MELNKIEFEENSVVNGLLCKRAELSCSRKAYE